MVPSGDGGTSVCLLETQGVGRAVTTRERTETDEGKAETNHAQKDREREMA